MPLLTMETTETNQICLTPEDVANRLGLMQAGHQFLQKELKVERAKGRKLTILNTQLETENSRLKQELAKRKTLWQHLLHTLRIKR